MAVACPVSQVMAPLLDNNHELNWQANMVDAIERKTANQHTEGESLLAPLSICTRIYSQKYMSGGRWHAGLRMADRPISVNLLAHRFFRSCGIPEPRYRFPLPNHMQSCLRSQTESYFRTFMPGIDTSACLHPDHRRDSV